jgi:hypothetical protein
MRLLLILPLAALLAIGCSRQDTSGQKGTPPGNDPQEGAQPPARAEKPTEYALDNGLRVRLVPSAGE